MELQNEDSGDIVGRSCLPRARLVRNRLALYLVGCCFAPLFSMMVKFAEPCGDSIYLVTDMSLAIIPNFIKPTMNVITRRRMFHPFHLTEGR